MARTIITATPGTGLTGKSSNTYDVEGAREQVEDLVALIAPYDTPCFSNFRKTPSNDKVVYWQEDDLAAPAVNAKVEGFEPSSYDTSTPGMKTNYTQIFGKTVRVTGSSNAVSYHGRANEEDYQILKRGREIRRDIEFAILQDTAAAAGTLTDYNTGAARAFASASRLINSANVSYGSGGSATGDAGTDRALTEALVLAVQQTCYNAGGNPNWLLVSPYHSTVVANFAYVSNQQIRDRGNETRMVNVVEIYISPFGELSVVLDKFIRGANSGETANGFAFLLETDRWFIPQLRPIGVEPLAKVGDSDRMLMTAEISLGVEHSKCSALIRDLTVS